MPSLSSALDNLPKVHPVTTILLAELLLVLAAAFLQPSSNARVLVPIVVAVMLLHLQSTIPSFTDNDITRSIPVTTMWVQLLKSIDVLCLSRLQKEPPAERAKRKQDQSALSDVDGNVPRPASFLPTMFWARIWWATKLLSNFRGIDTSWTVPNIPPFSRSNKSYVPSRKAFLMSRLITVILTYLTIDFLASLTVPDKQTTFSLSTQPIFSRLSEITLDEITIRVGSTLALGLYLIISLIASYDTLAILAVGLGISPPKNWPPIFGSFLSAYTLRNFWGKTWHQTWRKTLTANASFITTSLLRIPPHTPLSHHTQILTAFLISGLIHRTQDLMMNIPPSESGALTFFLMQALGLSIEEVVVRCYTRVGGDALRPRMWKRGLRYGWVGLWLLWTLPSWSYPQMRHVRVGYAALPVRVFG
ncbi:hypothetical protein MMC12_005319 [Toensbergia leucococca]|nr:hypothetical protein [Toensbergia leucococca]